jgi:proteic killer suppression protein
VIKSFADKATQKIYQREFVKRLPREVQQAGLRKLRMLNNAQSLRDLRSPPGNWLEKLKGDRAGQYSMRINDQWRVCFSWRENDAYEVEITDYHS